MLRRLADLRIAHKLYAGFGVVCLLLLGVVGISAYRLTAAQGQIDYLSTSGMASVDSAQRTAVALNQLRLDISNLVSTKDAADFDEAVGAHERPGRVPAALTEEADRVRRQAP